ncbi:hypothetical protein BCO18430_03294 [Burkholderia contaminans]|nr:hypothetical protein BCO18430_03294 [Burkholderia contaminans]
MKVTTTVKLWGTYLWPINETPSSLSSGKV